MIIPKYFYKVTTLSKTLAMALFVFLPYMGFYFGYNFHSRLNIDPLTCPVTSVPAPVSQPTPAIIDDRGCFTGEINMEANEKFFIGKSFSNMGASGEYGVLQKDYRLPVLWGRDYAGPNDTRPNTGVGGWSTETIDGKFNLYLNRTSLSDGTYTDFKFYKFKQNIFAIPIQYSGLIFGPDSKSISEFFETIVVPCWTKS